MPKYNSLLSTANAMGCRCDDELSYLALDNIVGLKVFTINSFDTNHDALTDISEYFRVYQNGRFRIIDEFLYEPYFSTRWVFSIVN
jgi:hypothetical protein